MLGIISIKTPFIKHLVVFTVLLHFTSYSQTKTSLDEGWLFHFGNSSNPEKDFNVLACSDVKALYCSFDKDFS